MSWQKKDFLYVPFFSFLDRELRPRRCTTLRSCCSSWTSQGTSPDRDLAGYGNAHRVSLYLKSNCVMMIACNCTTHVIRRRGNSQERNLVLVKSRKCPHSSLKHLITMNTLPSQALTSSMAMAMSHFETVGSFLNLAKMTMADASLLSVFSCNGFWISWLKSNTFMRDLWLSGIHISDERGKNKN